MANTGPMIPPTMSRRKNIAIGLVFFAPLALLLWTWFGPEPNVELTDGVSLKLPGNGAQTRTVVWDELQPLFPGSKNQNRFGPAFSPDGKTLIFASGRASEDTDLFVAHWQGDAWSQPEAIDALNSDADEVGPVFTRDGRAVLFASNRPGRGGFDLWVSRKNADDSWAEPENLGSRVNTAFDELDPAISADGRRLFFATNAGKAGQGPEWRGSSRFSSPAADFDIFAARLGPDFKTGPAFPIAALNSPGNDGHPAVSAHGDFVYFTSDREGGFGGLDLYRARIFRGEIQPPVNLGRPINSTGDEMGPALMPDGLQLACGAALDPKSPGRFALFRSQTREVVAVPKIHPFVGLVQRHVWVILACASALALSWWLLRRYFVQDASLPEKCFAGSIAAHLILLFFFGSWRLADRAMALREEQRIEVSLSSDRLAEEKLALNIRESIAELPEVRVQAARPVFEAPPPPRPKAPDLPKLPPVLQPAPDPAANEFAVRAPAIEPAERQPEAKTQPLPAVVAANLAVEPIPFDLPRIQLEANPNPPQPEPPAPLPKLQDTAPGETLPVQPKLEPKPAPNPLPRKFVLGEPAFRDSEENSVPKAPNFADSAPPPSRIPKVAAQMLDGDSLAKLDLTPNTAKLRLEQPKTETLAKKQEIPPISPTTPPMHRLEPPKLAKLAPKALSTPLVLASPTLPGESQPLAAPISAKSANSANPRLSLPNSAAQLSIDALNLAGRVVLEAPVKVKDPYLLRKPEIRQRMIEQLGGSTETEKAIRAALDWFTRHQEKDGHWDTARFGGRRNHKTASTAFALLSYMGWGATHQKNGPYRAPVSKGMSWLLAQMKEDGDLRGKGGDMYDQGIATIALAEAYGLTRDPKLHDPLQAAAGFILRAQSNRTGGWRYQPGDHNADTSVVGWQVLALNRAATAGIEVPPATYQGVAKWLDRVGGGKHRGLYGYQNRSPRPAMVAEGMFCQQLMGVAPTQPRMRESAAYLGGQIPSEKSVNYYYWYYGALALFQHGGPVWKEWNAAIKPVLLGSQVKKGAHAGSWEPTGTHGRDAGRVAVTAMAALTLEVYYRYLPMFER